MKRTEAKLYLSVVLCSMLAANPAYARFLQVDPVGYEDQINLYAYVENDPISKSDPTGEKWEVTYHQVMKGHSARHTAIRFTPDDQKQVMNNKQFKNIDADGNRYIVISAGPESNRLVSAPNRSSDVGPQEGAVEFSIPKGKSEFSYYNDVARADGNYDDNLDYDLFPARQGQGNTFVPDDGHNSNSFVSGLLGATGVKPPEIKNVNLPGYDKPVPVQCFKPGNSSC